MMHRIVHIVLHQSSGGIGIRIVTDMNVNLSTLIINSMLMSIAIGCACVGVNDIVKCIGDIMVDIGTVWYQCAQSRSFDDNGV